ncbi:hypothetical protein GFS24_05735 [Chitinophaga sp. SYP-B3965]|uniref:hypothetical protein n=1 Tax=Chitinophaga sp. SYP-B3965 TaxID=2663120 RepID=UPI0012998A8E|nr:hypothetical protein [Chitinophaga sp. SYP-B3965]MRG44603.1 hypothetical protein [Chitinophaga sp. SYP-B3965]
MKPIIIFLFLSVCSISIHGQDKNNYVYFNKLIELGGTEYVIATIENVGKMFTVKGKYLLFINTSNGQSKQVDFSSDASIHHVEQIRIDSLQINKVIVAGRTVNLDNSKNIDWGDPTQIIILSVDGQEKVQLTEDKFFAATWIINRQTGRIIITGHYDTNDNGKYDKTDKSEILLYDLKTLKLISKI